MADTGPDVWEVAPQGSAAVSWHEILNLGGAPEHARIVAVSDAGEFYISADWVEGWHRGASEKSVALAAFQDRAPFVMKSHRGYFPMSWLVDRFPAQPDALFEPGLLREALSRMGPRDGGAPLRGHLPHIRAGVCHQSLLRNRAFST